MVKRIAMVEVPLSPSAIVKLCNRYSTTSVVQGQDVIEIDTIGILLRDGVRSIMLFNYPPVIVIVIGEAVGGSVVPSRSRAEAPNAPKAKAAAPARRRFALVRAS